MNFTEYEFKKKFWDQIMRCSSCGFCQAVCPVYTASLRPGLNARGKILLLKEVMEGNLDLSEDLFETLYGCTACGICEMNCPAGVKVPEILKEVRKDLVNIGSCHPAFNGIKKILGKHTNVYAEKNPPHFGRKINARAQYVYFTGCVGLYRQTETVKESLKLLDRLKVDYTLIDEACCSGLLEDAGYSIDVDHATKITTGILATGARKLITGCPYCLRTFKHKAEYGDLRNSGMEIIHMTQFLKDFDFDVTTEKIVTYHDPCDLGRHAGIYEEPRQTIKKIAPNFVELENHHAASKCCGAGNGMRAAYAANAVAMGRARLNEVEDAGADILLTECNSCLHNLGNAKLRRQQFKIYHTAQFINALLDSNMS